MTRALAALPAVAFLLGVAPAAPVPPEANKPVFYYPTERGTELVYESSGGGTVKHVVTAVEKKDGALVVTLTQVLDNGQSLPHEKMVVTEKGLTRTEISGSALTPPLVMLRVPHPKGDKWEFAVSGAWGNGVEVKGTKVAVGVEKLKLPIGELDAVRVDSDYTLNGNNMKATFWYSPRVGVTQINQAQGQSLKLKSVTRPE